MTANAEKTIDLEGILPAEEELLIEGIPATVKRLKAKEFFALLRILTNGMGANIANVDFGSDKEEVKAHFLGLFIAAVPNAADEFVDFLHLVVEPKNSQQTGELNRAMVNPELETVIDVLTVVAEQEAPDIADLVGKAQAALKKIQSVYRKPTPATGK